MSQSIAADARRATYRAGPRVNRSRRMPEFASSLRAVLTQPKGEYTSPMETSQTADTRARDLRCLLLHPEDDVAVALGDLSPGLRIQAGSRLVTARSHIPRAHKVAVRDVAVGDPVRKYGAVIGVAIRPISEGDHVHTHNIAAGDHTLPEGGSGRTPSPLEPPELLPRSFLGYRRPDGRTGTRNHVLVMATVACASDVVHAIVARARAELSRAFANVDAFWPITHPGGCGLAAGSPASEVLHRCLVGMATHPNAGGVLVVGLGCETIPPERIARVALDAGKPARALTIQSAGGTQSAVELGIAALHEIAEEANGFVRQEVPVSALTVGVECGGSDAYSGITANPLTGRAGDFLVAMGSRWVLAESPETYGAERLLLERAASGDVASRLLAVLRRWEEYATAHGATLDNNPSPGNKEGGLTTIYEKALGAVAKGGSSVLRDVVEYAEQVRSPGLTFMDTPGMDNVSVTGLAAGGCNLIVFTTGRGSNLAFGPVPIVKVASSSELAMHMRGDMDFDAGCILAGTRLDDAATELAMRLIDVASGSRTRGECQGLGDHTFAPWDLGPTL